MTSADIRAMQARIAAAGFALAADGQWGPRSTEACRRHLRALMPHPHPWPASDEAAVTAFFGQPGDEAALVNLPVGGLGVKYDGAPVKTLRCHRRIAPALGRVLAAIAASPHAGILAHYAGCYNDRPVRGGTRASTHAWGIAIDLAPQWNGNRIPWPDVATMPLAVMEIFAREGFLSAGAFWGRDAMHFQATR